MLVWLNSSGSKNKGILDYRADNIFTMKLKFYQFLEF